VHSAYDLTSLINPEPIMNDADINALGDDDAQSLVEYLGRAGRDRPTEQSAAVRGLVRVVTAYPATTEEVVRETLALTISEAILSEAAAKMNDGSRPAWATADGERQIRETARALVDRAPLTITGPSTAEITRAVVEGNEAMRTIWMEP